MTSVELTLSPEQAGKPSIYTPIAYKKAGLNESTAGLVRVVRKSIDARSSAIKMNVAFEVFAKDEPMPPKDQYHWDDVSNGTPIVIIGSGPGGLFAALRLIELGYKPIILERGADVSSRKHDIAAINRNHPLNEESNYCFGEGGAGTYSDGKLFTRSKKRGNSRRILEIFNIHGASDDILYESHPHIGTEKLPNIISAIRQTILSSGGELHFNSKVTDLIIDSEKVKEVVLSSGEKIATNAVILATGHSARDIYQMLYHHKILMEAKPFAMGVRVEHPQAVIDKIQYKINDRGPYLPPATYSLVTQAAGRGVYSFCMCPGGFIVPASTAAGECVVNGMSPSGRNSIFANSGIVTEIRESDFADLVPKHGVLAGLEFQRMFEQAAFAAGGGMQIAPAQRLNDFVSGKTSQSSSKVSYHPGVTPGNMHDWMPKFMATSLRLGFTEFNNKMKGFVSSEAMILGVESRTSSPVRIPRDKDTMAHPQLSNLFPCGEGAGYAGGIVSSAVDGERIAESIAKIVVR
ncbi:MAG: FAD-dependent oxidoreductase [Rikenellaceae bacterium]